MLSNVSSLSIDVLRVLQVLIEAERNPAIESYQPTEEEMKLFADFQDPGVQDAVTLGLVQLRDALLRDIASKGLLAASLLDALDQTLSATAPSSLTLNPGYYPNAFYGGNSNTPIKLPAPNQTISLSRPPQSASHRPGSPPRSGAIRRIPSKRKFNIHNSPFSTCQWDSCGQKVENSNSAIISHLLSCHRVDLKSRNGIMECGWTGCGDSLLITSVAKHITSTHLRLTVVECPYCPGHKSFSRGDSLNAHIRARHASMFDSPSRKWPKM